MSAWIRVFPRRTSYTPIDDMAFVGEPPLPIFLPKALGVMVSVTFTWDIPRARELAGAWSQYYTKVVTGGPAYIPSDVLPFLPGFFVKEGITFTSRGCPNKCAWCLVPEREGGLYPLPEVAPGHIIGDNNFLACPKEHRLKVYAMLNRQKKAAVFSGGLQASLVTEEIASELRDIRIAEVFLAADTEASLKPLERAVKQLQWLKRRQLRCYVLIGFNDETIEKAWKRLESVWEIGCLPFAQLYRAPMEKQDSYSQEWRALAREWSRPAAMITNHIERAMGGE